MQRYGHNYNYKSLIFMQKLIDIITLRSLMQHEISCTKELFTQHCLIYYLKKIVNCYVKIVLQYRMHVAIGCYTQITGKYILSWHHSRFVQVSLNKFLCFKMQHSNGCCIKNGRGVGSGFVVRGPNLLMTHLSSLEHLTSHIILVKLVQCTY